MGFPPTTITNDESDVEEPLTSDSKSSSKLTIEQKELTTIVDAVVESVLSRVEKLFVQQDLVNVNRDAAAFLHAEKLTEDMSAEHRYHAIWLERKRKEWKGKDRRERRGERRKLVEEIEEVALRLGNRDEDSEEPIVLVDAVGRKFVFPFERCRTWAGFRDLVKQAFLHVEIIGPQVLDGYYDILSPKGHMILPSVWDEIIEPGWELGMHMWPMPETYPRPDSHPPPSQHDVRFRGQESMADDVPIVDEHRCHRDADGGEPHVPTGPLWDTGEEGSQCASIGSCGIVDDPVVETGSHKAPALSSLLSQKSNSKTEQEESDGEGRLTDCVVLADEPVHDAVYDEWDALIDEMVLLTSNPYER